MKHNITLILALSALFLAGCDLIPQAQVDLSGSKTEPAGTVDPNAVSRLTLSRVLQKDPNNSGGLEIQDEFPEYFQGYRFDIYREDGKIRAVEIHTDMPFEIYPEGTPSGKVEAYFDNSRMPWTIRQKSNDQILAIYSVGKFYYPFRLGCQEVSYELQFKSETE
ncbi:MAG: hypothetical protein IJ654_03225 [Bacteroidales bacterium]|nr:hypothetical protein [Bacteroidales bacterium]